MKKLIEYVEHNYNRKDIAHIYSIILRTNYEMIKHDNSFELNQMDNFNIKYNNEFEFTLDNNIFKITKEKIKELVNYIYNYYEKEYPINYDYKLIDPIYFSLFFYDLLDKIIHVKEDTINIKDIRLLRYKSNPVKMEDSERYKALLDTNYKI